MAPGLCSLSRSQDGSSDPVLRQSLVRGYTEVQKGSLASQQPLKRRRTLPDEDSAENLRAVRSHPLGVKPLGNVHDASRNIKELAGSFSLLPDALFVHLLECFDAPRLLLLGSTCKALYAFCHADDLWRTLFIESSPKSFAWCGTWRNTCLRRPKSEEVVIRCADLYSDVLYRPFFCANTPLHTFASKIPRRNSIVRLRTLGAADFNASWTDKPFILTDAVTQWPIYRSWERQSLLRHYGDQVFRAEAVDWPLQTYVNYMGDNNDESPLYLFDCRFAEKMQLRVSDAVADQVADSTADYTIPEPFTTDLFKHLDESRPDHRWMILGPARSGSTFHADPNGTSAWNAVLSGRKYWLMFPPPSATNSLPPGVFLSADGSDITSPLSIAEYLLGFHDEARRSPGCVEAVCEAGEVLHVPSGWMHLVLNLEEGVAVTQNFVPERKLPDVLAFLKDKPDQVSGFREGSMEGGSAYDLFVDRLRRRCPATLDAALMELERKAKRRKTAWDEITKEPQAEGSGFSFGFGANDDIDIPS